MAPIQNEAGVHNASKHFRWHVRQFKRNVSDDIGRNSFLDKSANSAGYAVFGSVVSGMDLVQSMGIVSTSLNGTRCLQSLRRASFCTSRVVLIGERFKNLQQ